MNKAVYKIQNILSTKSTLVPSHIPAIPWYNVFATSYVITLVPSTTLYTDLSITPAINITTKGNANSYFIRNQIGTQGKKYIENIHIINMRQIDLLEKIEK